MGLGITHHAPVSTVGRTPASSVLPPLRVAAITAATQGVATPEGALNALRRALASGADVVVAPEWFFICGHDPAAFASLVQQVRALTVGSDALVIPGSMAMCDRQERYRNLVVAFSNGRALYSYAKRHNGADQWVGLALGAKAWQPGQRDSLFHWRGRSVSIEICADHQNYAAKTDLAARSSEAPDLQIVIAAGAKIVGDAVVAKEGGAVLCTDGTPSEPRLEAYRVAAGRLAARTPRASEPCGATTIHYLTL